MRLDLGLWHGEDARSLRQRREDLPYTFKPQGLGRGFGGFNE